MLRSRRIVAAIAAVLILVGILQLRGAPVDVLPEFMPVTVDVQTEALGLSAIEVEQLITVPLEQDLLNGVAWLDRIESQSVPGLSSVHLIFDPGTDLYHARQLVQERISQAAGLPNVSKPPQMLQPTSSTGRVMMIGLSSKNLSLIKMSVLARWVIVPKLMGVPGVANVATWGQREQQLQVQADPQRLRQNNVTLLDVIKTTGNALWYSPLTFLEASTPGTGGFIDTSNQRVTVMHLLPISTPEELAQVAIERSSSEESSTDGVTTAAGSTSILRLGEVANVVENHQPLIGDALFTDQPGLLLVIDKLPGADVWKTTRGLQNALEELLPGLSDMQVDYTVFRPATYISHGLTNLMIGLIIAGVLIVLALAGLFFDWRSVFIGVVVIATGLATAELILRAFGATFNWMSIAGLVISFVLVIDIVVSCLGSMRRRLAELDEGADQPSRVSLAGQAARDVRGVAIYTLIIVLVSLLPIFSARGSTAAVVRALSLSFALAVVTSTAAALLVAPALMLMLLPKGSRPLRDSPAVNWLKGVYRRGLFWMIRLPRRSWVPALAIAVIAIVMMPFMRGSLVPAFKDTNVLVQITAAPGTSLTEMSRIVGRMGEELKTVPGVNDVGGHIGRAILGDQIVNVNSSVLWVDIEGTKNYEKTINAIRDVATGYPGLDGEVLTYPNSRIADAAIGRKNELTVRVYGADLDAMSATAQKIRDMASTVKGVNAADVETFQEEPGYNIEVDLAKAQKYGIKPGDARRAAAALISGFQVGSLFEENKVFDVVVWGTPEVRTDLSSIQNLLIDAPSGESVRLGDIATITVGPNPTVVTHDAVSRKLDVTLDIQDRSPGSVADEIEARLAGISFPVETHAEVLGAYDEIGAMEAWMLALGCAAVLGCFLLIQASLNNWRLALLAFLSSLVALTGGIAAAFLMDRTISPAVLLGLAAVFGIAVRHSILLVHDCRRLQNEPSRDPEDERIPGPTLQLVAEAAAARLGTLVITVIAVGLAVIPLVSFGNAAGLEVLHAPLVAVLCSLVTLVFVSLFVMPALYLRFGYSWRKQHATS